MHVGMGVIFQAEDERRTDRDVYQNELRLAELAEPLGFDSIWGVEHHFTNHTICPDVLQYLTYIAARTQRIQLGSMVVVLPWHHPMRVAEQVMMLDHMSGGRVILGIGRGLGRVEFEGLGVRQEDSREIFTEAAQMILQGLERGYCEFNGKFVKQVRRDIRPRPFKSFRGRTYAAAVSPESALILAKLGIGILIMPQKPGTRWRPSFESTGASSRRSMAPRRHRRSSPAGSSATRTRSGRASRRTSTSAATGARWYGITSSWGAI